jgi:hypothetical protein
MKNLYSLWRAMMIVALACLIGSTSSWADAPGRVARLSSLGGEVLLANDREDWRPITRNYAVTAGDNLSVSEGGRAELDVGAVQVWLAGGSNVYFERFDDQSLIARLSQGSMIVRIRAWEPQDAMRLLTNSGEISLLQAGFYIVNAATPYAPATLVVRSGQAEAFVNGQAQLVNRGDSVMLDGNGVRFDRYAASTVNGGFEGWASARDRRYDRWEARNAGQSSPWMIGARDLDEFGSWETHYEYGRIWYPTSVASGWAPYRFGRWAWVQPWGWTWVDDAAWGFAPFHYGRWVRIGSRWAWSPGNTVGRPVYAPALVTFFGGNGWSVSANLGPTYSWVPLGWNEPFVPWYTYSPNYWRHVNRPYVRNIAEDPWRPRTYVHANVPGAITAIAGSAFVTGRPVAQNLVRNIAERDLRSAPPARMGEVVPQFQSGVGARPADPNPVAPGQAGIVRERSPREMAPGTVQSYVAPTPNTNVLQPRVWQDPNPVVGRPYPAPQRQGVVSENPGLRPPGVPMSKDPRERAIQRGEAPAPVAPVERVERRAMVAPSPAPQPVSPPRVVEQRAVPPAIAPAMPPAPVIERPREQPRAMPTPEPRGPRDKDRAPVTP